MRTRLYGLLAGCALVTTVAVVVTELTKGQCSIVCTWQVPLLIAGAGAASAFLVVGGFAIVYEVRQLVVGESRR